jgi:hypothetical protein
MDRSNVLPFDRRQARPGECLYCFLTRMSETTDCDHTLKLTRRWIDVQPRSARWVVKWVQSQGGSCDCEALDNALRDDKRSVRHQRVRCAASYGAMTWRGVCGGPIVSGT